MQSEEKEKIEENMENITSLEEEKVEEKEKENFFGEELPPPGYAKCKRCGHTWKLKKFTKKKKKCGLCGSNAVVVNIPEEWAEEEVEEKRKKSSPKRNISSPRKKKSSSRKEEEVLEVEDEKIEKLVEEDEEEKKRKNGSGRSWLFWIAAVIFIIGLLYWFLSSVWGRESEELAEGYDYGFSAFG